MKINSTTKQAQQMIEFEAQIKRATGLDSQAFQRVLKVQKETEAVEKMLPWNVMGISRETFTTLQEIAAYLEIFEDAEATVLMELAQGDDSDALSKHIENNPVSPECIIKLVKLAKSVADKYTKGLNNEGRIKGGETTKKRADEHKETLKDAVVSILKNPATSDWSNPRIARFLMEPTRAFHKSKGKSPLGEQTMTDRVKKIREEYKEGKITS